MANCKKEIVGVRKIALYINDGVRFSYPDPSIENEVDLIAHATGSYVISDVNEYPKWERELNYSGNYKLNYRDTFSFFIHGVENETPEILRDLRNNRNGYVCEIITTGGKSYVFPTPIFLSTENVKQINSHSWEVALSYRVPTFSDKLTKLNTILMANSYILVGENQILGDGSGRAIISN